MWLLDRFREHHILRLGASAVELWRASPTGLCMASRVLLQARASAYESASLANSIGALVEQGRPAHALVVIESALCPVLLADTGCVLWNAQQVDALLRHRLRLAYGGPGIDITSWKTRAVHRYGDRHALGFALPPAVEGALLEAARLTGVAFQAWTTAFSWGFDRSRPWRSWARGTGWWAWGEQDRVVLGHFTRGRLDALDPAVPQRSFADGLPDLIESKQRELGLAASPATVGSVMCWRCEDLPSHPSDRLTWSTLESPISGPAPAPAGVADAQTYAKAA